MPQRNRYYVGLRAGVRQLFKAPTLPTQRAFPQYQAVIGPFRTKRAAIFMAEHGNNNPHLQTVNDAERIARHATA